MNLVLRLRELRRLRGFRQDQVAKLTGIGVKTISSFETGARIRTLKLGQLELLLGAYGVTLAEFFGSRVADEVDRSEAAYIEAPPAGRRIECVIVQSERDEGLVSIRPLGGGKGGTFKRLLTEAGFRPGDCVAVVPSTSGEIE